MIKILSNFKFKGKTVLLRADLNSDVINGRVIESERFKAASTTIKELKKKGARVIILAHQGQEGREGFVSLKKHVKFLNKYVKVKFVDDILGKRADKAIAELGVGEALLLENIRFEKDEFKPEKGKKNKIVSRFLGLIDIYLNDAFSVSHRNHVSLASFPKYVPSGMGRVFEGEVKALKKINVKKCLCVLGGAKPEDNIKLLKGQKVLACGLFGQVCVIAKGKNLGAQNKYLKNELYLVKKLKGKLKNVLMPVDFAVRVDGNRRELMLEEFPSKYEIFDIGAETMKMFVKEIRKAKMIYMKGPAGFAGDKKFAVGTFAILHAIAKSKGFSIIGGGHLNDAIRESRINKKRFGHVSLSGGALLNYLAGEKLPGLEALK